MKYPWIVGLALGGTVILALALGANKVAARSTVQGGGGTSQGLLSFVKRDSFTFSNGAVVHITILVGPATLTVDSHEAVRMIGTVSQISMEEQSRGDLTSMMLVSLASANPIGLDRSLPIPSSAPENQALPTLIGHWIIQPTGNLLWSQVAGDADVTVLYSETSQ